MSGLPAHRGNLDYQDCRRVVVVGHDGAERDWLRGDLGQTQMATALVAPTAALLRQSKVPEKPARMLLETAYSGKSCESAGSSDRVKTVAVHLHSFLPMESTIMLRYCARRFAHDVIPRRGAAEGRRVGDRQESKWKGVMRRLVLDNLVEAARSSIQTAFCACVYSTKPNMTCGPLLKHMEDGMRRLERQLEREENQKQLENLARSRMLHGCNAPVCHLGDAGG